MGTVRRLAHRVSGTAEVPWGKWLGTFNDGTAEARQKKRERAFGRKRHRLGIIAKG